MTSFLRRPAVLTLLLLASCWPVWLAYGWMVDLLPLDPLGLIGRVCALFLFLGIAEIMLELPTSPRKYCP